MTFKVDENLPEEAADLLVAAGYEADTVRQEGLAGVDDPVLAVLLNLIAFAFGRARNHKIILTPAMPKASPTPPWPCAKVTSTFP